MKRSFFLLTAVVVFLVLLSSKRDIGRPSFFYLLVMLMSIVSVITGTLRLISGKRSWISWVFVAFSVVVLLLSYYLVTQV